MLHPTTLIEQVLRRLLMSVATALMALAALAMPVPALAADTVPSLKTRFGVGALGGSGCGNVSYGFDRGPTLNETWCMSTGGVCNHAIAIAEYGHLEAAVNMTGSGGACGYRSAWTSATFSDSCVIAGGTGSAQVRYRFSFGSSSAGVVTITHSGNAPVTVTPASPVSAPVWFTFGSRFTLTVQLDVNVSTTGGDTSPVSASQAVTFDGIEIVGGNAQPCLVRMGGITCTQYEPFGAEHPGPVIRVDPNAPACGDGRSWATALNDLPYALQLALLAAPDCPMQVWVKSGVYKPAGPGGSRDDSIWLPPNAEVFGGFAGTESSPSQRNIAAHPTVLSGDLNGDDTDTPKWGNRSDNSRHVVRTSGSGLVALDGFTIRGGNSDLTDCFECGGGGGGILAIQSSVTLRDCTIIDNRATGDGGGMRFYRQGGGGGVYQLTLERCTFSGNLATDFGGAVSAGRTVCWSGGRCDSDLDPVDATDCMFVGNISSGGGAVTVDALISSWGYQNSFVRCRFENNSGGALNAGGPMICTDGVFRSNSGGALSAGASSRILRSVFEANTAYGSTPVVSITSGVLGNSVLSGNTSATGAILNTGAATIGHCVIASNTSTSGPIMALSSGSVFNSVMAENKSTSFSGYTLKLDSGTIRCSTFYENTFSPGASRGVIKGAFGLSISNCIIWANHGGGSVINNATADYSIVQGGFAGTGNLNAEPQFSSPILGQLTGADGRWFTCDDGLRLASNSPAINVGSNALAPADAIDQDGDGNTTEPTPFDLAGQIRTQGGTVDMGAYECGPSAAAIVRQPAPVAACPLATAALSVLTPTPTSYTYQWRRDGSPLSNGTTGTGSLISGATTDSLAISNVSELDNGSYDCVASNSCGSVTSDGATLTVCPADYNCDTFVNGIDFDQFVSDFEGGLPTADVNHDGWVNGIDFDYFVEHFEAGC